MAPVVITGHYSPVIRRNSWVWLLEWV